MIKKLTISELGPIKRAEIELGDLTVLVGPQATGKSLFLQMLNLMQEKGYIKSRLNDEGYDWNKEWHRFISLYLGEGMQGIWNENSSIEIDKNLYDVNSFNKTSRVKVVKTFYIPAQRVLTMENGWPKTFKSFSSSYPYSARDFSETIRFMMDQIFTFASNIIFPHKSRLRNELKDIIEKYIYHNASLELREIGNQKRLILKIGGEEAKTLVSMESWSAGQREFAPLLMGLYWALPPGRCKKRNKIETIIIEEPETCLHPSAIIGVMFLIMELLHRNYKVLISTHSNIVLDVFWGILEIKKKQGSEYKFLDLFDLKNKTPFLREIAVSCLKKRYKIYYFKPDSNGFSETIDISELDPGDENPDIAGWGGLSEYSFSLISNFSSNANASAAEPRKASNHLSLV